MSAPPPAEDARWLTAGVSVCGARHLVDQTPCQDAVQFYTDEQMAIVWPHTMRAVQADSLTTASYQANAGTSTGYRSASTASVRSSCNER